MKPFMLLMTLLLLPLAFAQETVVVESSRPMIVPPMPPDGLTLSQNHFYSVNFDGEGEATIAAKIAIQNTGKEPLDTIKLEIPGTSVRLINALQEVQDKKKRCSDWGAEGKPYYDTDYEDVPEDLRRHCRYWYDYYETKYFSVEKEANVLSKSVQYTITLPKALGDQETTNLILYYKAEGYTEKSFGVFNFDFETIKLNQDINQVRVAVTVQEDLYLKGVESQVEYRGAENKFMTAGIAPAPEGVVDQNIQQFSSQIEWSPGLVKTAQGLDPLESFHVKGEYAKSRLALYQGGIWISLIVLLALIIGMIFGIRKALRMGRAKPSSPALAVVGGGVGAAIGLFAVWVIGIILMNVMRKMIGYPVQELVGLLVLLVVVLFSLVIVIGTPIFVGYRHGVMAGLLTAGVMMLTLVVLAIIAVVFMIAAGTNTGYPGPIIY